MVSILILITCITVVFGQPTHISINEVNELILLNLTSEAKKEFFRILVDDNLFIAEMDKKFDKWARKHGISEKWTAYTEKHLAKLKKFNEIALSVVGNLPDVLRKQKEIDFNRNLTRREAKDASHELEERYHLESRLFSYLNQFTLENEKTVMNGGNMCYLEMRNSIFYTTVDDEVELIFQNLTLEARNDYWQIRFGDFSIVKEDEKTEEWAEKYGILGKWTAYIERWLVRKEKYHEMIRSVTENLPFVYSLFSEITSNRNQTNHMMKNALTKLKEIYCLEMTFILDIKHIVIQNDDVEKERRKRNRRNIETGNNVFPQLRDSHINGNFKALLLPGPF